MDDFDLKYKLGSPLSNTFFVHPWPHFCASDTVQLPRVSGQELKIVYGGGTRGFQGWKKSSAGWTRFDGPGMHCLLESKHFGNIKCASTHSKTRMCMRTFQMGPFRFHIGRTHHETELFKVTPTNAYAYALFLSLSLRIMPFAVLGLSSRAWSPESCGMCVCVLLGRGITFSVNPRGYSIRTVG